MSGKVTQEEVQLRITVGGNQAKKELGQLEQQARELTQEQKALRAEKAKLNKDVAAEKKQITALNKELKANREALKKNKDRQAALRKEIGLTGLTMRQLNTHIKTLQYHMHNATPGTEAWKRYNAELTKAIAHKQRLQKGVTVMGQAMRRAATTVNHYAGMMMAAGFAIYKVYDTFIQGNAKLSDQLSDVEKHTNLTRKELNALYLDLRKADTRTSREELLKLASVAGKLGIEGRQNILEFVKASDQITVALGEDMGQSADDAVKMVGKIVDVFDLDKIYGIEQAMLKAGSAVNTLGQSSSANEGYIVEWTNRVQGIAKTAGIAMTDVMGLASANDQLAQSAEVSSTVFTQVVPNMFKDTATYAKVAGMEVGDFTKLLKTDANEAFIALLDGLNGNNDGLDVMTQKLDGLGLDGKRVISVLLALARDTDKIREAQDIANESFKQGTSITDEFSKKNENLAGNLAKIGRRLKEITTNIKLESWLTKVTGGIADLIKQPLAKAIREQQIAINNERIEMNKLVMQITSLNEGEGKRIDLINELIKKYPQYYGEIDAATISNNKLRDSLKEVNRQMIRQAYIAGRKEELADLQENASKKLEIEMQYHEQLETLKASYFSKMGKQQQEVFAGDFDFLMQQFTNIQKKYSDNAAKAAVETTRWLQKGGMGKQSQGGLDYGDMVALSISYNDWREAYKKKYKAESDAQKEFDKISAYEKRWGLDSLNTGSTINGTTTGGSGVVQQTIDIEALRIEALTEGIQKEVALELKRHNEKLVEYKNNAKAIEYEEEIHQKNLLEIRDKYAVIAKKQASQLAKDISKESNQGISLALSIQQDEEEETFDPETSAEIQKFLQTQEFKESFLLAQYENGVLSEGEYLEKIDRLRNKYNRKDLARKEDYFQWGVKLAGMASDAISSLMNMELQQAADNEEKKKEIKKKYADVNFMIITAQIAANTALAIMNAFAHLPIPAAIVAAALIGATGLIQQAVAIKQRQAVKQMAGGGYATVYGADDGRQYRARVLTQAGTGMLPNNPVVMPSGILASEAGQEYYVDNKSLSSEVRDAMGLRISDHVAMIDAMKNNTVLTQRIAGGYSDVLSGSTNLSPSRGTSDSGGGPNHTQPYTPIDVDKFDRAVTRMENLEWNLSLTELNTRLKKLEKRNNAKNLSK